MFLRVVQLSLLDQTCIKIPPFKCILFAKKTHKGGVCVFSHSVVSNSLRPHGLYPTRLLCPWNFSGKNTGVGCHSLLLGIFPTQELNPGLPHCRWILCHLSHQGSLGSFQMLTLRVSIFQVQPRLWNDWCFLPLAWDLQVTIFMENHRKITAMTFGKYQYSVSGTYFFITINKCLAPISYFQIMEVGPKCLQCDCSTIHQGKQNVA